MPQRDDYLFARCQARERDSIERLLLSQGGSSITPLFLASPLNWNGRYSWYAVRIPTARLLPVGMDPRQFPGDVDMMGGPLYKNADAFARAFAKVSARYPELHPSNREEFALRATGSESPIVWPPPLDFISAAEVKSLALDARGKLKGIRGGLVPGARRQTEGLCRMGFDRAALLCLIVTEPVIPATTDVHPWSLASDRAGNALLQLARQLASSREPGPVGEIALSLGAVPGGLEDMRGAMSAYTHHPTPTLLRAEGSERLLIRTSIEAALKVAFDRIDYCPAFPVVIRACTRTRCHTLFIASPPDSARCPDCGLQFELRRQGARFKPTN